MTEEQVIENPYKSPADNRDNSISEESISGLGNILFEKKIENPLKGGILVGLLGSTTIITFAVVLSWYLLLLIPIFILVIALGTWYFSLACFRCHDHGVYKYGLTGEKTLKYTEVSAFTYSVSPLYVNGIYSGTNLELKFQPHADSGQKTISYLDNLVTHDDDLELLRDHITKIIATKMAEQCSQNIETPWTRNMTFSKEGLRYRPSGIIVSRKEEQLLSWENFDRFDISEGYFYLWEKGNDKSIFNESVTLANFWPGFYLFCNITAPERPNLWGD